MTTSAEIWARCSELTAAAWVEAEKMRPKDLGLQWLEGVEARAKMQQYRRDAEHECYLLDVHEAAEKLFQEWVRNGRQ
jgi:hypothetical protein